MKEADGPGWDRCPKECAFHVSLRHVLVRVGAPDAPIHKFDPVCCIYEALDKLFPPETAQNAFFLQMFGKVFNPTSSLALALHAGTALHVNGTFYPIRPIRSDYLWVVFEDKLALRATFAREDFGNFGEFKKRFCADPRLARCLFGPSSGDSGADGEEGGEQELRRIDPSSLEFSFPSLHSKGGGRLGTVPDSATFGEFEARVLEGKCDFEVAARFSDSFMEEHEGELEGLSELDLAKQCSGLKPKEKGRMVWVCIHDRLRIRAPIIGNEKIRGEDAVRAIVAHPAIVAELLDLELGIPPYRFFLKGSDYDMRGNSLQKITAGSDILYLHAPGECDELVFYHRCTRVRTFFTHMTKTLHRPVSQAGPYLQALEESGLETMGEWFQLSEYPGRLPGPGVSFRPVITLTERRWLPRIASSDLAASILTDRTSLHDFVRAFKPEFFRDNRQLRSCLGILHSRAYYTIADVVLAIPTLPLLQRPQMRSSAPTSRAFSSSTATSTASSSRSFVRCPSAVFEVPEQGDDIKAIDGHGDVDEDRSGPHGGDGDGVQPLAVEDIIEGESVEEDEPPLQSDGKVGDPSADVEAEERRRLVQGIVDSSSASSDGDDGDKPKPGIENEGDDEERKIEEGDNGDVDSEVKNAEDVADAGVCKEEERTAKPENQTDDAVVSASRASEPKHPEDQWGANQSESYGISQAAPVTVAGSILAIGRRVQLFFGHARTLLHCATTGGPNPTGVSAFLDAMAVRASTGSHSSRLDQLRPLAERAGILLAAAGVHSVVQLKSRMQDHCNVHASVAGPLFLELTRYFLMPPARYLSLLADCGSSLHVVTVENVHECLSGWCLYDALAEHDGLRALFGVLPAVKLQTPEVQKVLKRWKRSRKPSVSVTIRAAEGGTQDKKKKRLSMGRKNKERRRSSGLLKSMTCPEVDVSEMLDRFGAGYSVPAVLSFVKGVTENSSKDGVARLRESFSDLSMSPGAPVPKERHSAVSPLRVSQTAANVDMSASSSDIASPVPEEQLTSAGALMPRLPEFSGFNIFFFHQSGVFARLQEDGTVFNFLQNAERIYVRPMDAEFIEISSTPEKLTCLIHSSCRSSPQCLVFHKKTENSNGLHASLSVDAFCEVIRYLLPCPQEPSRTMLFGGIDPGPQFTVRRASDGKIAAGTDTLLEVWSDEGVGSLEASSVRFPVYVRPNGLSSLAIGPIYHFGKDLRVNRPLSMEQDAESSSRLVFQFPPTVDWVQSHLIPYLASGNRIRRRDLVKLLKSTRALLDSLPNVLHITIADSDSKGRGKAKKGDALDENGSRVAPRSLTVIGDTHGQFFDVLTIFAENGMPSLDHPYLFNGDFVDRGEFGLEIVSVLCALKLACPAAVHLLRGNHETIDTVRTYGFMFEVCTKYRDDTKLFDAFMSVFAVLPLCSVVNNRVFICHGGLPGEGPPQLGDISKIQRRTLESDRDQLMTAFLWSDPMLNMGTARSPRLVDAVLFGPDITAAFCRENEIDLFIRSHEMKEGGFDTMHLGHLMTVFSAPNYGERNNLGAYVRLQSKKDGIHVSVYQFSHVAPPAAAQASVRGIREATMPGEGGPGSCPVL